MYRALALGPQSDAVNERWEAQVPELADASTLRGAAQQMLPATSIDTHLKLAILEFIGIP
jgi:hypothetical protein